MTANDPLTIEDKYGDNAVFTLMDDGDLDITIDEDDKTCCVIIDKAQVDKLRGFIGPKVGTQTGPSVARNPNEAKLRLAVDFGLRVRFDYTGDEDHGVSRVRRVEPEALWTADNGAILVGGESYDEDGDEEGYRQFRLDRIDSAVTVR